jgi:hypothetical protein
MGTMAKSKEIMQRVAAAGEKDAPGKLTSNPLTATNAHAAVHYTCAGASWGGRLAVSVWAREHGCPWSEELEDVEFDCCALDAHGGYLVPSL